MKIRKITKFTVDDKEFVSVAKAQDYLEGEINKILQRDLIPKGFSVSEIVKITETVLQNGHMLSLYLTCELPDDDED